jgi:hypothetical protein
MLPQAALTFLQGVGKAIKFWHKNQQADSLISFTQTTRVEPICILDQRALHLSYTTDILQALNSVFAAYYLQAAAISVNVGKIEVGKLLGHLNPDRQSFNAALEALIGDSFGPAVDYRFGLPSFTPRPALESLPAGVHHALEAKLPPELQAKFDEYHGYKAEIDDALGKGYNSVKDDHSWYGGARPYPHEAPGKFEPKDFEPKDYQVDPDKDVDENGVLREEHGFAEADRRKAHEEGEAARKKEHDEASQKHEAHRKAWDEAEQRRIRTTSAQGFGGDLSKDMREAANLAVGRMYTVNITDGGHSASIPVLIRLLTTECTPELLVHILSDGARVRSSSAKERWFDWKMGNLKFWKDLVFCCDLIDEHKKALLKDDNGVYGEMLRRRRGNATVTGINLAASKGKDYRPSVGTASNLIITTRQTIKELESQIGGKFDDFSVRQKVFEQSYLMIVVVVDPDYDHVTFYYRGIAVPSEFTVRDLKKVGKEGSDLVEVLKALSMGSAPRF